MKNTIYIMAVMLPRTAADAAKRLMQAVDDDCMHEHHVLRDAGPAGRSFCGLYHFRDGRIMFVAVAPYAHMAVCKEPGETGAVWHPVMSGSKIAAVWAAILRHVPGIAHERLDAHHILDATKNMRQHVALPREIRREIGDMALELGDMCAIVHRAPLPLSIHEAAYHVHFRAEDRAAVNAATKIWLSPWRRRALGLLALRKMRGLPGTDMQILRAAVRAGIEAMYAAGRTLPDDLVPGMATEIAIAKEIAEQREPVRLAIRDARLAALAFLHNDHVEAAGLFGGKEI